MMEETPIQKLINWLKTKIANNGKPILLGGFLKRYFAALLATAAFMGLALSHVLFKQAGTLIYLPVLFFGALVCAFLARHLFFRNSMDRFVHLEFVQVWNALDSTTKLKLTLYTLWVLFGGACLIAAGLVR